MGSSTKLTKNAKLIEEFKAKIKMWKNINCTCRLYGG